jgi:hypothetical protein
MTARSVDLGTQLLQFHHGLGRSDRIRSSTPRSRGGDRGRRVRHRSHHRKLRRGKPLAWARNDSPRWATPRRRSRVLSRDSAPGIPRISDHGVIRVARGSCRFPRPRALRVDCLHLRPVSTLGGFFVWATWTGFSRVYLPFFAFALLSVLPDQKRRAPSVTGRSGEDDVGGVPLDVTRTGRGNP